MTATETSLSRAARLDRLPFTREHGRLVGGSGLGWALDAMDVGLISFVMAALVAQEQWGVTPTQVSWIGSIGFVGMAIGATLGGLLADRVGRRQVFALTLLVFGVATGAAALSWSVGALLVFRFLIGLGLGAELPVASTLVSEFAPARVRGRVVVALEAFWAVGWTLAALIGYFAKVFLLGVFLVLFRNAEWLSPMAFAITAIVVSLASTTGEILAFTRVRPLIYDEPAEPGPRR